MPPPFPSRDSATWPLQLSAAALEKEMAQVKIASRTKGQYLGVKTSGS